MPEQLLAFGQAYVPVATLAHTLDSKSPLCRSAWAASLFLAGSDFTMGRFAAPWCDWLTCRKQRSVPLCVFIEFDQV